MIPIRKPLRQWNSQNLWFLQAISWQRWKKRKLQPAPKTATRNTGLANTARKYFLSDDTNPETAKAVELSETILPAIQHKNASTSATHQSRQKQAPAIPATRYCPDCDTVVEKGYTYWNEDNLTWKLYADGTLNISGTGAMKDYNADWQSKPCIHATRRLKK